MERTNYEGMSIFCRNYNLKKKNRILESIPIEGDFDEFCEKQNELGIIEEVITADAMRAILEEYFLKRKYEIIDCNLLLRTETHDIPKILRAIARDRAYFYLLHSLATQFEIESITLRKGVDQVTVHHFGIHSTQHKEDLHTIIWEVINDGYAF